MEDKRLQDEIMGFLLRRLVVARDVVKDFVEDSNFDGDWAEVHKIMERFAEAGSKAISKANKSDTPLDKIELFAYLGEDQLGSGVVGLKQAYVPAGLVPLVATTEEKLNRVEIKQQLQEMVDEYGKAISFCRYRFEGVIFELKPKTI